MNDLNNPNNSTDLNDLTEMPENRLDLFTNAEAAMALRISPVKLWEERKAGRISFRRAGRRLLYTRRDLTEYLESRKQQATV